MAIKAQGRAKQIQQKQLPAVKFISLTCQVSSVRKVSEWITRGPRLNPHLTVFAEFVLLFPMKAFIANITHFLLLRKNQLDFKQLNKAAALLEIIANIAVQSTGTLFTVLFC